MIFFICFSVLAALPASCLAAVIHVPSEQPTIQAGIDFAMDGDTVLLLPGTYAGDGNRDIVVQGKAVSIVSVLGPDATIISCEGSEDYPRGGFTFINVDSTTALKGLTVTGGWRTLGGAVLLDSASPSILNCIFLQNDAPGWASSLDHNGGMGGALCCQGSSPVVLNCTFVFNVAHWSP